MKQIPFDSFFFFSLLEFSQRMWSWKWQHEEGAFHKGKEQVILFSSNLDSNTVFISLKGWVGKLKYMVGLYWIVASGTNGALRSDLLPSHLIGNNKKISCHICEFKKRRDSNYQSKKGKVWNRTHSKTT